MRRQHAVLLKHQVGTDKVKNKFTSQITMSRVQSLTEQKVNKHSLIKNVSLNLKANRL